jgi:HTH-type transcriptional repressor of NAD biosynthesis genes
VALTVILLGGESTGKSTLAEALQRHLSALDLATTLVPEHLRHWCAQQGRAPRAEEQAALADEQARLIDSAAEAPGTRVVIADTAPLVIAAYSELYFGDSSLFPAARDWQRRRAGLTLLMGLDLPWVPDDLFRDSPAVREATDAVLRRELQAAGLPYQTIYGQGDARLREALRAIGPALGQPLTPADPAWRDGQVPWNCEKCSDPDCEHRLFTRLIADRTRTGATP